MSDARSIGTDVVEEVVGTGQKDSKRNIKEEGTDPSLTKCLEERTGTAAAEYKERSLAYKSRLPAPMHKKEGGVPPKSRWKRKM